jgi:hypothetical protein
MESASVVVLCYAAHALEIRVRAAPITIAAAKLTSQVHDNPEGYLQNFQD